MSTSIFLNPAQFFLNPKSTAVLRKKIRWAVWFQHGRVIHYFADFCGLKGTKLHFKLPTAERRHASCVGGWRGSNPRLPAPMEQGMPALTSRLYFAYFHVVLNIFWFFSFLLGKQCYFSAGMPDFWSSESILLSKVIHCFADFCGPCFVYFHVVRNIFW